MIYAAALLVVAGVALYVAAPLIAARRSGPRGPAPIEIAKLELDRLAHDRALAVQALRELEFDREMKKLSAEDYRALREPLEARALGAMAAIQRARADIRASAAREVVRPLRAIRPLERRAPRVVFCPQCGVRVSPDANFCVECGAELHPLRNLAAQAD